MPNELIVTDSQISRLEAVTVMDSPVDDIFVCVIYV